MINTSFLSTYNLFENNDDATLLYNIQFLQIFNLKQWDDNIINSKTFDLFNLLKNNLSILIIVHKLYINNKSFIDSLNLLNSLDNSFNSLDNSCNFIDISNNTFNISNDIIDSSYNNFDYHTLLKDISNNSTYYTSFQLLFNFDYLWIFHKYIIYHFNNDSINKNIIFNKLINLI
jgi:hypothetical protein|tara:strand:- start:15836 stop:16360 length:525 start_codon:yes stop_codon:yes gene_type:complete